MACLIADRFVAGTTFSHRLTLTANPAPDWGLTLIMRGPAAIDIIAMPDGRQHHLLAPADLTATWAPGVYWWAARAVRGIDVVQVAEGQITITPDIAQAGADFDGRSHAARVLASIEAVIEGRATTDQQKYTINNRELWRTPIADLLLLRDRYRAELLRQQQAGKCGQSLLGRQIKVIL